MLKNIEKKTGVYLLGIIVAAFLISRIPGLNLFENNWSFLHFESIPGWYFLVWSAALITTIAIFFTYQKGLGKYLDRKFNARLMGIFLFAMLIFFRFDSIVFGGSNLRINQLANSDYLIIRWFEYDSIFLVDIIYQLLLKMDFLFKEPVLYRIKLLAAANSWVIFSFICIVVASISAFKITHEMSPDHSRRWLLFVIIFFGPQAILYFGYPGIEPVIVAFTYWMALFAIKLSNRFTTNRLLMLWFIQILAVLFYFNLIFLLPAAIYISYRTLISKENGRNSAVIVGIVTYVILLIGLYYNAQNNFELSKYILFFNGKNPHTDYGLFSLRHLSDFFQSLLLVFPQIIILIYMLFSKDKLKNMKGMGSAVFLSIGGLTMFFLIDPVNSMPFDLPRLTAYLTPLSIVIAIAIKEVDYCINSIPIFTRMLAVLCLFLPLSYIPIYTNINLADEYLSKYLGKNEKYFMEQSISFRDAYFHNRAIDKANYWEWEQPKKSEVFLSLQSAGNLVANGEHQAAIKMLNRIVVEYPYLVSPRQMIYSIQLEKGNPQLAKPQIDTCLILEPDDPDHRHGLFLYYRNTRDYVNAIKTTENSLKKFKNNTDLLIDLMAGHNTVGNVQVADSVANIIIEINPNIAYPYAVKGFISERLKKDQQAIEYYEKFIRLAPEDPETPNIRKRLNELVLKKIGNN